MLYFAVVFKTRKAAFKCSEVEQWNSCYKIFAGNQLLSVDLESKFGTDVFNKIKCVCLGSFK